MTERLSKTANLETIRETDHFSLAYDPTTDPLAVAADEQPNYFIIFKGTGKVEAESGSIVSALDILRMAEEMLAKVSDPEPEEELAPARSLN